MDSGNAREFYLLYARLEEKFGGLRHCMDVLDRATTAVPAGEKLEVYLYYAGKVSEYYGASKTREIWTRAMETVPAGQVKEVAVRFADLETKLGGLDRARGIFVYAAQFCNPQTEVSFWEGWREFEVRHGNSETFKEMKRLKRSVQAEFAQVGVRRGMEGREKSSLLICWMLHLVMEAILPSPASSAGMSREGILRCRRWRKRRRKSFQTRRRPRRGRCSRNRSCATLRSSTSKDATPPSTPRTLRASPPKNPSIVHSSLFVPTLVAPVYFASWITMFRAVARSVRLPRRRLRFRGSLSWKTSSIPLLALIPSNTPPSVAFHSSRPRTEPTTIAPKTENRDRFKRLFLALQTADYVTALKEMKTEYARGYVLPRTDIYMLVSRLCETHHPELLEKLVTLLNQYDTSFFYRDAPLFSYAYLFFSNIRQSFTLLSSSSDAYLAEKAESVNQLVSSTLLPRMATPSLPQEYLFAHIAIQMMCNATGTPFPHLSRNDASQSLYSTSILHSFLMEWSYLRAAMCSHSHEDGSLTALFPSPYRALSGSSTDLSNCVFSSLTQHHCRQRLDSTLRALTWMLWFQYSRGVYEMAPARGKLSELTDTIEEVFRTVREAPQLWPRELFEFFLFFFSQPAEREWRSALASLDGKSAPPYPAPSHRSNGAISQRSETSSMRDVAQVTWLLQRMQEQRLCVSETLALTLFGKPDCPSATLDMVMAEFLDENRGRPALVDLMAGNTTLVTAYVTELGLRGEAQFLRKFYERISYLSLPLPLAGKRALVLAALLAGDRSLAEKVAGNESNNVAGKGMESLGGKTACAFLLANCDADEEVKRWLDEVDRNWRENDQMMTHVLFQVETADRQNQARKEVKRFCAKRGVSLDGATCAKLGGFYAKEGDVADLRRLVTYMKRKNLFSSEEKKWEMEATVKRLAVSTRSILGELGGPGRNRKYESVGESDWRRGLCVLMRDPVMVSVDMMMESVVKELCYSSILKYGTWLWVVCCMK